MSSKIAVSSSAHPVISMLDEGVGVGVGVGVRLKVRTACSLMFHCFFRSSVACAWISFFFLFSFHSFFLSPHISLDLPPSFVCFFFASLLPPFLSITSSYKALQLFFSSASVPSLRLVRSHDHYNTLDLPSPRPRHISTFITSRLLSLLPHLRSAYHQSQVQYLAALNPLHQSISPPSCIISSIQ